MPGLRQQNEDKPTRLPTSFFIAFQHPSAGVVSAGGQQVSMSGVSNAGGGSNATAAGQETKRPAWFSFAVRLISGNRML
ncbi:MAG: hypothetical protein WCB97_01320 [Thiobacillus sp.]